MHGKNVKPHQKMFSEIISSHRPPDLLFSIKHWIRFLNKLPGILCVYNNTTWNTSSSSPEGQLINQVRVSIT